MANGLKGILRIFALKSLSSRFQYIVNHLEIQRHRFVLNIEFVIRHALKSFRWKQNKAIKENNTSNTLEKKKQFTILNMM